MMFHVSGQVAGKWRVVAPSGSCGSPVLLSGPPAAEKRRGRVLIPFSPAPSAILHGFDMTRLVQRLAGRVFRGIRGESRPEVVTGFGPRSKVSPHYTDS